MKIVDKYAVIIRCTYYNKHNVPEPVYSGSFEYDIEEEFIGLELDAVERFRAKYGKRLEGRYSITVYDVLAVYKVVKG